MAACGYPHSQDEWRLVAGLLDPVGRAAVLTRLARLGLGNPGDVKPVGAGVWELRIDVYLMLGGGDKSSQAKDVDRAIRMASELKSAVRAKKASCLLTPGGAFGDVSEIRRGELKLNLQQSQPKGDAILARPPDHELFEAYKSVPFGIGLFEVEQALPLSHIAL